MTTCTVTGLSDYAALNAAIGWTTAFPVKCVVSGSVYTISQYAETAIGTTVTLVMQRMRPPTATSSTTANFFTSIRTFDAAAVEIERYVQSAGDDVS
jgi:hypothetical protein